MTRRVLLIGVILVMAMQATGDVTSQDAVRDVVNSALSRCALVGDQTLDEFADNASENEERPVSIADWINVLQSQRNEIQRQLDALRESRASIQQPGPSTAEQESDDLDARIDGLQNQLSNIDCAIGSLAK